MSDQVADTRTTYLISNLVYGQFYPEVWLDNHLKSLLDPSNLPAIKDKYKIEYAVFTDDETFMKLSRHPNWMQLGALAEIHVIKMNWPAETDRFNARYGLLVQMFHQILPLALEKKAIVSSIVADLVFAKGAVPKMLSHMEKGHDGVFMVPIRGAADSINHILAQMKGAPSDLELFNLCYHNLHHLWTHSHWDSPLFSKFPYSMVWNSGSGLVTHNFGITPIMFRPNEDMKKVQGVIDADVPSFCKNPYWATDWTDAPVAGVEPLSNGHYPPFLIHRSSVDFVIDWAKKGTNPVQRNYLHQPLFYPCKSQFNNEYLADSAKMIACQIQTKLNEQIKEQTKEQTKERVVAP